MRVGGGLIECFQLLSLVRLMMSQFSTTHYVLRPNNTHFAIIHPHFIHASFNLI